MPSGTAINKTSTPATGRTEGRDALDAALTQSLRRLRRSQPADGSDPRSDISDPSRSASTSLQALPSASPSAPSEDTLLRYMDGALDTQAHAQVERYLLGHPGARARVAALKGAMDEAPLTPAAGAAARVVFCWVGGALRFLRGSCDLLEDGSCHEPGSPQRPAGKPSYKFSYQFPAAEAVFQLSPPDEASQSPAAPLNLTVTLNPRRPESLAALEVVWTTLGGGTRPAQRCTQEGAGPVALTGLDLGRHELRLRRGDVEVGALVVELRKS